MGLNLLNTTDMGPKNEVLFGFDFEDTGINTQLQLTSGLVKCDVSGNVFYTSSYINGSFGDASIRSAIVYKGASSGSKSIKYIYSYNDNLVGILDVSGLVDCTNYTFRNSSIENIIFPNTHTEITRLDLRNNNLQGTLDISGLTNLTGEVYIDDNNLSNIIFPDTSTADNPISTLQLDDNDLLSIVDMSKLKNLGGYVTIIDTYNITEIKFPVTNNEIYHLNVRQNDIQGILDVSGLTGLWGYLSCANNYDMTGVLLPETSAYWDVLHFGNCNLSGVLDLSHVDGSIRQLYLNQNSLTDIILPDNDFPFYWFDVQVNQLTSIDVSNRMFEDCYFQAGSNTSVTKLVLPDASCSFRNFNVYGIKPSNHIIDVSNHYFTSGYFSIAQCDISLFIWDVDKFQGVTNFNVAGNTQLKGTLDVSSLSSLTSLGIYSTGYTEVLLPIGASNFRLNANGSLAWKDTIDFSMLSSIDLLEISGVDVSTIIWPDSSNNTLLGINIVSCNFSGEFDLSMFKNLDGNLFLNSNNITSFKWPEEGMIGTNNQFRVQNNNLQGTLDISTLNGLYYFCEGNSNPNLEEVLWPDFTNWFSRVDWGDCSLNQSTIDNLLSKLNTYYSTGTVVNLTIDLAGGTNMPPTDGSQNSDILSLETIFSNAGRTLTLSYNT